MVEITSKKKLWGDFTRNEKWLREKNDDNKNLFKEKKYEIKKI